MLSFAEFCVEHDKRNEANTALISAVPFAETTAIMEPVSRIEALCCIAELQTRALEPAHRPDSWHMTVQAALQIFQQESMEPPQGLVDLASRYLGVRTALIGLAGTTGNFYEPNSSIDIGFLESIVEQGGCREEPE